MSGTQAANGEADGAAPPLPSEDIERLARLNGWRPKDEFKGDAEKWIPADEFLAVGFERPAVLRERNRVLTERLQSLEHTTAATTRTLEAKLDGAVEALNNVTALTRSAETRAYERARRELREQAATAVANADTATFTRVQTELDELDKTKPPPAPVATARTEPTPPAAPPGGPPPAAVAFFARNPWYHANAEMMMEADIIHTGLMAKQPNLSLEQNLAEVERRMKAQFPDKTGGETPRRQTNGAANGDDRQQDDDDDDRRGGASPVTPSSRGTPPRRPARNTFAAMPQEAKDAYKKYADLLKGKGEPFTEAEYAASYWAQFEET